MNNDVKDKGGYFDGEIDKLNVNDAVGKIDLMVKWLRQMRNQIKEDRYYRLPITITFSE